jgi:hypothetical protein
VRQRGGPRLPGDVLAERASPAKPCVVVLDNAALFHTAGVVRERETAWEAQGLRLHRLPAYSART